MSMLQVARLGKNPSEVHKNSTELILTNVELSEFLLSSSPSSGCTCGR